MGWSGTGREELTIVGHIHGRRTRRGDSRLVHDDNLEVFVEVMEEGRLDEGRWKMN